MKLLRFKNEKYPWGCIGKADGDTVTVITGSMFGGLSETEETVSLSSNTDFLPPVDPSNVVAVGANYIDHQELLARLEKELGNEVSVEKLVDLHAVSSHENDLFVQMVYSAYGISIVAEGFPRSLPYLTDGSVLQPAYNGVPTIILGPGQPEMGHQTDEFCYTAKIEEAVEIYKNIILKNGGIVDDKIS